VGLSFYRGEAFPAYKGGLLVALAGSWNATTIAGYELRLVTFGADGKPNGTTRLLPHTNRSTSDATVIRTSFYPYHMAGLTVSPEGWIYVSIVEGRIYRFRPQVGS
jgi:glucose/arabinose dehydrogenase